MTLNSNTVMSESSTHASVPVDAGNVLRVTSNANAEHYVWGNQCDGWHLVRTPSLGVIAERMPAGTFEVAHRHNKAQQFFFVLSGELTLESNGVRVTIRAREGAHVAPMVVHQALNVSDAAVEFLVISEPPSHGDRVNV
jgi:mannose-6-phosphate isomerase-like protein (cupin superfamily)